MNDMEFDYEQWRELQANDFPMGSWWDIASRDKSDGHDEVYHGCFVPQIPHYFIYRFTKPGDTVFDPMMGSGTTGIEAVKLGRNFLGVDINQDVCDAAEKRIRKVAKKNGHDVTVDVGCGDVMDLELDESPDLVMFHPPYLGIIQFNPDNEACWGNLDAPEFLRQVRVFWNNFSKILKPGAHVVLVIGDVWRKGEYYPLAFNTLQQMLCCDLELRGIVVKNVTNTKNQQKNKNLWYYRAAKNGTFVFQHEYIMLLRRKGTK